MAFLIAALCSAGVLCYAERYSNNIRGLVLVLVRCTSFSTANILHSQEFANASETIPAAFLHFDTIQAYLLHNFLKEGGQYCFVLCPPRFAL